MPFPISIVGRSTAPVTHEVDAAWLTGFARVVDSRADDRVEGRVGHPLFPVCIEWPAVTAAARLDDGALLDDERRRGIHATHDLTIHRLLRPGDVVTTTATIEALDARPRGTFQRLRLDTRDAEGSLVATTLMGSMFIGVAIVGSAPADEMRGSRAAAHDDAGAATIETVDMHVPADQARAYSEASRIWNPIHTDAAAAVAAGLAAPILHGTCTLAMATSAALTWAGTERPDALRRIRARFSGMVAMPSALELRVWRPSAHEVCFEVVDSDHAPVLRDGRLTFTP
jgi:MaoC like domain.